MPVCTGVIVHPRGLSPCLGLVIQATFAAPVLGPFHTQKHPAGSPNSLWYIATFCLVSEFDSTPINNGSFRPFATLLENWRSLCARPPLAALNSFRTNTHFSSTQGVSL